MGAADSREQRRERRRELLEAAKRELEWRVFIATHKPHEAATASATSAAAHESAAPPPPPAAPAAPTDTAASTAQPGRDTAKSSQEEPGSSPCLLSLLRSVLINLTHTHAHHSNSAAERKREDLGRRMMRRRLRRAARETARDPRLPVRTRTTAHAHAMLDPTSVCCAGQRVGRVQAV
jgi:hypothetical protein